MSFDLSRECPKYTVIGFWEDLFFFNAAAALFDPREKIEEIKSLKINQTFFLNFLKLNSLEIWQSLNTRKREKSLK